MSGSTFGLLFRVTNFGESHGPAIGCVIDGCPPGLGSERSGHPARSGPPPPRHQPFVTQRNEPDAVGDPVRRLRGQDHRHADLSADPQHRPAQQGLRQHPRTFRPGHADYTYWQKYGLRDPRGGGRSSARLTRADGGCRCGGQEMAAAAPRHHRFRLDDPARRRGDPVRGRGASRNPFFAPAMPARWRSWRPTWTRCASPATRSARA